MLSQDVVAEAAVWVARLHGPDRSTRMERDCLEWQSRSPEHRLAFERCTEVWQQVPGVGLREAFTAATPPRATAHTQQIHPRTRRWLLATSLLTLLAIGGAAAVQLFGNSSYSTEIGEQRLVILDDGTRMTLNTSTSLDVSLSKNQRTVHVATGEALFEVAKDPSRPFVVKVDGREVVALGTAFAVRYTPDQTQAPSLSVTLIEGRVALRPEASTATSSPPTWQLVLHPGERVRFSIPVSQTKEDAIAGTPATVDHPRVDQVVAWKRGEASFDDVSLDQAVSEMNRYSRTPVVLIGTSDIARLRVSGVFHTGNSVDFARALAKLHGLTVRELRDRIELTQ